MRVVSLACSNTEIVCALGRADALVGVDDHSDRPASVVARLPRVGPDLAVDVERVAALRPDLVLASLTVPGHERVVAALHGAGLPTRVLEPTRLEHVARDVLAIASALGVPERGAALVARMEAAMVPVALGPDDARPRVLVQWWPRPTIAPAGRSWVTDMIRAAGGANPLGDRDAASLPLADEEVVDLDPEVIVLAWCGVAPDKVRPEVVLRKPAWRGVAAVRTGRVHAVPEALLGRPGPGLVEGFAALATLVRDARPVPPPAGRG